MPTADLIAFLGLIVGLSAYVATMRLRLIDQIKSATDDARKRNLKNFSLALTLADAPLVVSGILLFFHGFWDRTFGKWAGDPQPPDWMLTASVWLFTVAILNLAIHHSFAWWKSVRG
jgi:hypothetical protein